MQPHEHNLWVLLFEQTPVVFRWIFTILTLGVYWLMQTIYKNHKERVEKIEKLIKENDKENTASNKALHEKVDRLIFKLIPDDKSEN